MRRRKFIFEGEKSWASEANIRGSRSIPTPWKPISDRTETTPSWEERKKNFSPCSREPYKTASLANTGRTEIGKRWKEWSKSWNPGTARPRKEFLSSSVGRGSIPFIFQAREDRKETGWLRYPFPRLFASKIIGRMIPPQPFHINSLRSKNFFVL